MTLCDEALAKAQIDDIVKYNEELGNRRKEEFNTIKESLIDLCVYGSKLLKLKPRITFELIGDKDLWLDFDFHDEHDPIMIMSFRNKNDGKCVAYPEEKSLNYFTATVEEAAEFWNQFEKNYVNTALYLR